MNISKRIALTGMIVGMLGGCGSTVTLQTASIPTPLIEKIPASVGLRMPAEFDHFVHNEEIIGREHWTIDLGNSNAALFKQLFGFMFENVTLLSSTDNPQTMAIDALIEPTIDAFEFSVPNQSKTESFAVWIRYRIKVYDQAGLEVANWPVSAYGKSQTASVSGSEALERAAILAMRDAAALMIMKLDEATGISMMAASNSPSIESTPTIAIENTTAIVQEEPVSETE